MVDGIDGLAVGLTLVIVGSLIFQTLGKAPDNETTLLAFLCTSILTFMVFNLTLRSKIKVFIGDAGSAFLGCAIAIAIIYFSQIGRNIINLATALWLVAIPMMDIVSTMLRRMGKGKSHYWADRTHLHHMLMRVGLSQRQTVLCMLLMALGCALVGMFMDRI